MVELTVRLSEDRHAALRAQAIQNHVSMNDLFNQWVDAYLRSEEDRELYEGFERLGNDPEDSDVEYAFAAQAEVVQRHD